MSPADRSFRTAVEDVEGIWPDPPAWFSYSSFRDAEDCPRRWALSRATYPSIWTRPGYPELPHPAAVLGDVVHQALERIVKALVAAGCDSGGSAAAVAVLREMGGYSAVVAEAFADRLAKLTENPRMKPRLEALSRYLQQRLPEMRQRTQATLSRTRIVAVTKPLSSSGPGEKQILDDGSHPELELRSTRLAWAGRADLVTIDGSDVQILDYKTGKTAEHHADQLRTYALLWSRRDDFEPLTPLVTRLTLSYSTHDDEVPAPSASDLDTIEADLLARSTAVRAELAADLPSARPAPDRCGFCSVRHLCDDYWEAVPIANCEDAVDIELTVVAKNGPRSFRAIGLNGQDLLIRVPEEVDMALGARFRVLGAYSARDDEGNVSVSVTSTSELHRLRA